MSCMERLKRNFYSLGYYCTPNLSIHQNSTQKLTWNFLVTLPKNSTIDLTCKTHWLSSHIRIPNSILRTVAQASFLGGLCTPVSTQQVKNVEKLLNLHGSALSFSVFSQSLKASFYICKKRARKLQK